MKERDRKIEREKKRERDREGERERERKDATFVGKRPFDSGKSPGYQISEVMTFCLHANTSFLSSLNGVNTIFQ
jgi:hypothetical protein